MGGHVALLKHLYHRREESNRFAFNPVTPRLAALKLICHDPPPSALSVLNLGIAEVVRLQKTQNSYEFGYPKIKT